MNCSGAGHALVSGISPPATSLFSWTEAGLEVLHEAVLTMQGTALSTRFFYMNYRDASIRGLGDFASGDQLAQLDRGRTESPARSYFDDAKHRGMNLPGNQHLRGMKISEELLTADVPNPRSTLEKEIRRSGMPYSVPPLPEDAFRVFPETVCRSAGRSSLSFSSTEEKVSKGTFAQTEKSPAVPDAA